VWLYKVSWAKKEAKPQKKIHKRLKQSLVFFPFIYLFIYYYYYYLDKEKTKEKLIYFFYFIYLFIYIFLKKKIIIIDFIIYLARRNWVLTTCKLNEMLVSKRHDIDMKYKG